MGRKTSPKDSTMKRQNINDKPIKKRGNTAATNKETSNKEINPNGAALGIYTSDGVKRSNEIPKTETKNENATTNEGATTLETSDEKFTSGDTASVIVNDDGVAVTSNTPVIEIKSEIETTKTYNKKINPDDIALKVDITDEISTRNDKPVIEIGKDNITFGNNAAVTKKYSKIDSESIIKTSVGLASSNDELITQTENENENIVEIATNSETSSKQVASDDVGSTVLTGEGVITSNDKMFKKTGNQEIARRANNNSVTDSSIQKAIQGCTTQDVREDFAVLSESATRVEKHRSPNIIESFEICKEEATVNYTAQELVCEPKTPSTTKHAQRSEVNIGEPLDNRMHWRDIEQPSSEASSTTKHAQRSEVNIGEPLDNRMRWRDIEQPSSEASSTTKYAQRSEVNIGEPLDNRMRWRDIEQPSSEASSTTKHAQRSEVNIGEPLDNRMHRRDIEQKKWANRVKNILSDLLREEFEQENQKTTYLRTKLSVIVDSMNTYSESRDAKLAADSTALAIDSADGVASTNYKQNTETDNENITTSGVATTTKTHDGEINSNETISTIDTGDRNAFNNEKPKIETGYGIATTTEVATTKEIIKKIFSTDDTVSPINNGDSVTTTNNTPNMDAKNENATFSEITTPIETTLVTDIGYRVATSDNTLYIKDEFENATPSEVATTTETYLAIDKDDEVATSDNTPNITNKIENATPSDVATTTEMRNNNKNIVGDDTFLTINKGNLVATDEVVPTIETNTEKFTAILHTSNTASDIDNSVEVVTTTIGEVTTSIERSNEKFAADDSTITIETDKEVETYKNSLNTATLNENTTAIEVERKTHDDKVNPDCIVSTIYTSDGVVFINNKLIEETGQGIATTGHENAITSEVLTNTVASNEKVTTDDSASNVDTTDEIPTHNDKRVIKTGNENITIDKSAVKTEKDSKKDAESTMSAGVASSNDELSTEIKNKSESIGETEKTSETSTKQVTSNGTGATIDTSVPTSSNKTISETGNTKIETNTDSNTGRATQDDTIQQKWEDSMTLSDSATCAVQKIQPDINRSSSPANIAESFESSKQETTANLTSQDSVYEPEVSSAPKQAQKSDAGEPQNKRKNRRNNEQKKLANTVKNVFNLINEKFGHENRETIILSDKLSDIVDIINTSLDGVDPRTIPHEEGSSVMNRMKHIMNCKRDPSSNVIEQDSIYEPSATKPATKPPQRSRDNVEESQEKRIHLSDIERKKWADINNSQSEKICKKALQAKLSGTGDCIKMNSDAANQIIIRLEKEPKIKDRMKQSKEAKVSRKKAETTPTTASSQVTKVTINKHPITPACATADALGRVQTPTTTGSRTFTKTSKKRNVGVAPTTASTSGGDDTISTSIVSHNAATMLSESAVTLIAGHSRSAIDSPSNIQIARAPPTAITLSSKPATVAFRAPPDIEGNSPVSITSPFKTITKAVPSFGATLVCSSPSYTPTAILNGIGATTNGDSISARFDSARASVAAPALGTHSAFEATPAFDATPAFWATQLLRPDLAANLPSNIQTTFSAARKLGTTEPLMATPFLGSTYTTPTTPAYQISTDTFSHPTGSVEFGTYPGFGATPALRAGPAFKAAPAWKSKPPSFETAATAVNQVPAKPSNAIFFRKINATTAEQAQGMCDNVGPSKSQCNCAHAIEQKKWDEIKNSLSKLITENIEKVTGNTVGQRKRMAKDISVINMNINLANERMVRLEEDARIRSRLMLESNISHWMKYYYQ